MQDVLWAHSHAGHSQTVCDAIGLLPWGPRSWDTLRKHYLDAVKFNLLWHTPANIYRLFPVNWFVVTSALSGQLWLQAVQKIMPLFVFTASSRLKNLSCMPSFDWLTCIWTKLDNVEEDWIGTSFVLFCFFFHSLLQKVSNTANMPHVKTDFNCWAYLNSTFWKKKDSSSKEHIHMLMMQPNWSFCCANKAFFWGLSSPIVNKILSGLFCQVLTDRKNIWQPSSVNAAWEETLGGRFDPLRLQIAN